MRNMNSAGAALGLFRAFFVGVTAMGLATSMVQAAARSEYQEIAALTKYPVTPRLAQQTGQPGQQLFNLGRQPLTQALRKFSQQTGIQVAYNSNDLADRTTEGLSGMFTPEEALSALLEATDVDYRFTYSDAVLVRVAQADTSASTIALDTIVVHSDTEGLVSGTPEWIYNVPSSVSAISREQIESRPVRNARDLFDTVPGVWVNRTEAQNPGISINIRGLQDQNRVVTMIDGARQNFQRNAHGTTQRTYVDTAFIREIAIEKSGTSGVGGAGALGGSVDFRTIGADDLIEPGEQYGGEINLTTGTNAYDFYGFAFAAMRLSSRLAITGGISLKELGEYEIGQNGIEDYTRPILGNLPQPIFTGAETRSSLLKLEAQIADNLDLTVGWLRYDSESSQGDLSEGSAGAGENMEDILNDTLTAALAWNPASNLVDLKARLWYNNLDNKEVREERLIYSETDVDYGFATVGGSLENTSRLPYAAGELALNYGFEAFRDEGTTNATSADADADLKETVGFGGLNPGGTRDVASGFANATLEHGAWLTLSGGIRYDWYRLEGNATYYDRVTVPPTMHIVQCVTNFLVFQQTFNTAFYNNVLNAANNGNVGAQNILNAWANQCGEIIAGAWHPEGQQMQVSPGSIAFPARNTEVDQSDAAWLPTATVAVKLFPWLQPFAKYSQSFRPPNVMEALVGGGHAGMSIIEFAPNPDLQPETARTWEAGVNVTRDGLLTDNDKFRTKVVGFRRDVDDYIVVGTFMLPDSNLVYNTYLNVDGTTTMEGIEVEAAYDAGFFYVSGAFTYLVTDWPDSYDYSGSIQTTSTGKIINSVYVPPRRKLTIDGGVRLFGEKLTLGGRVTDVGVAEEHFGLLGGYPTKDYRVYDIYGSYAITEDTKLLFTVDNVTDVAYVPALGEWAYPAPGRTATVSVNLKF